MKNNKNNKDIRLNAFLKEIIIYLLKYIWYERMNFDVYSLECYR